MKAILATLKDGQTLAIDGKLPWFDVPELKKADMGLFRKFTKGKNLLMGRNTWLNDLNAKRLPGRGTHYIMSEDLVPGDCFVIQPAEDDPILTSDKVCIGGKTIYDLVLPKCEQIFWSVINMETEPEGKRLKLDLSMDELIRIHGFDVQWCEAIPTKIPHVGVDFRVLYNTRLRRKYDLT